MAVVAIQGHLNLAKAPPGQDKNMQGLETQGGCLGQVGLQSRMLKCWPAGYNINEAKSESTARRTEAQ